MLVSHGWLLFAPFISRTNHNLSLECWVIKAIAQVHYENNMYYCQLFFKLGGEEEIALHDINSETKKVFTSEGKLGVGLSAVVFFAAPPHNMK